MGFFSPVPVKFAYCWDPGELSPAADVNTYHIMHSSCNTIPLSLSVSLYIDVTKCFSLGGCYFGGVFFTCAC